jgi:hypothetical protein
MRTTIDIPDPLFRKIKSEAALRGETLKGFLLRAARSELEVRRSDGGKRARFPLVRSKAKTYDLNPKRLAEIMEEEDRELIAGH